MPLVRKRSIVAALLIEALVSFALMFSVALTVMGLQAQAHRAKEKARSTTVATSFARQLMEKAKNTTFDKLTYGTTTQKYQVSYQRGRVTGKSEFVCTQLIASGPTDKVKSILLTVTWASGTITLEGYVGSG